MSEKEQEAVDLAGLISGAGETEQPLLQALCTAEWRLWEGRLRQGVTPESCGAAFICAVAFTAAADLAAGRSGILAFTAGSVSVRETDGTERTDGLRRTARELMAPYTLTEDFCFKGVRG